MGCDCVVLIKVSRANWNPFGGFEFFCISKAVNMWLNVAFRRGAAVLLIFSVMTLIRVEQKSLPMIFLFEAHFVSLATTTVLIFSNFV